MDIYKFVLEFGESDVKTQEEEVSGFAIADLKRLRDMLMKEFFFIMTVSDRRSKNNYMESKGLTV